MQIVEENVKHKTWGTGIIVSADDSNVSVFFDSLQKSVQFNFPYVFKTQLTFEKDELQAEVLALCSEKVKKIVSGRKKKNEGKLPNEHPLDKKMINNKGNLVFKLNYCDGGSSKDCIGFKGICSDTMIRYNIDVAKRRWCGYEDCPCFKYFTNKITRSELEESFNSRFACYESKTLIDWVAHAGNDLNGNGKIINRHIKGAQNGSLAILTTRLKNMPEENRIIFGVFVVDSVTAGNDSIDGRVACKSKYHIELTPSEAQKVKFWKYYRNHNNPESKVWGSGLYRYIDDDTALRLLQDIVEIKRGTADYELAVEILEYYRELHA